MASLDSGKHQTHGQQGAITPDGALFEGFAVCGLASPLIGIYGEDAGCKGYEFIRFKPSILDQLSSKKLPLQLPTCCMPDGVEVVPAPRTGARRKSTDAAPKVYSVVLTDEAGRRLYVSCLSYLDVVPPGVACRHEELVGARATRTLCLISKLPYLKTAEQVLRRLYVAVFYLGPSAPVGDLVSAVLRLPNPAVLRKQVWFSLEGRQCAMLPPDATGLPRGGEVSLRPLLKSLSPANTLLAFLAVLLERRVVVISRHLHLPTLAAEGLKQLLWPMRYQHVYVPLVPAALIDLLDAPTPFLMGLGGGSGSSLADELAGGVNGVGGGGAGGGCSAGMATRVHEGLVVVDLDRDWVYNCSDLRPCLDHPAVVQLFTCLAGLAQHTGCPSALNRASASLSGPGGFPGSGSGGGSGLGEEEEKQLARIAEAEAAAAAAWAAAPPNPDPMVGLRGGVAAAQIAVAAVAMGAERQGCPAGSGAVPIGDGSAAARDPWMSYVRTAAASAADWGPPHDALVRRLFLRLFAVLLRGYQGFGPSPSKTAWPSSCECGPGATSTARTTDATTGRPCGGAAPLSPSLPSQQFNPEPFLRGHVATHGPKARPLVAQLVQTQGFYVLLDEYGSTDPYGWYTTACAACRAELSNQHVIPPPEAQSAESPPGQGTAPTTAHDAEGSTADAAAAAAAPLIVIGAAAHPAAADLPANPPEGPVPIGEVTYSRPCPLLQLLQRRPPVYRSFPALHVSDQQVDIAAAAGATAGPCSAPWHSWQWHIMPDGLLWTASESSGGGLTAVGVGTASGGGGGSCAGILWNGRAGVADGDVVAVVRRRPAGSRRNRSRSGSISGDPAAAAVVEFPKPRHRISTGDIQPPTASPGTAAELPSTATSAGSATAAGGDSAAVTGGSAAAGSHMASPSYRAARRATVNIVSACYPVGIHPAGPPGGLCRTGLGFQPQNLANYAAEQELVRQQISALMQVLSWGEPMPRRQPPPPPQPQQMPPPAVKGAATGRIATPRPAMHSSVTAPSFAVPYGGTAGGAAFAPAAAQGRLPAAGQFTVYVPDEAEVERIRRLLCLQTGGNGAFLVGRLREVAAATCTSAASSDGTGGTAGAAASGGGAGVGGGISGAAATGRCLHPAAYGVLTNVFDALVTAAVQHQDFGALGAALELASSLYTSSSCGRSGQKLRLLPALSCNPYLYTRFVWAGIFSHKLLTAAVATAAGAGERDSCGRLGRGSGAGADAGPACGELPAPPDRCSAGYRESDAALTSDEAFRRQRALLMDLQRSLCAQATWLAHLGISEEPAWEMLAGLVSASGLLELPVSREGDLLYRIMLNVRAAMRIAQTEVWLQRHRGREGGGGVGQGLRGVAGAGPARWLPSPSQQTRAGSERARHHRASPAWSLPSMSLQQPPHASREGGGAGGGSIKMAEQQPPLHRQDSAAAMTSFKAGGVSVAHTAAASTGGGSCGPVFLTHATAKAFSHASGPGPSSGGSGTDPAEGPLSPVLSVRSSLVPLASVPSAGGTAVPLGFRKPSASTCGSVGAVAARNPAAAAPAATGISASEVDATGLPTTTLRTHCDCDPRGSFAPAKPLTPQSPGRSSATAEARPPSSDAGPGWASPPPSIKGGAATRPIGVAGAAAGSGRLITPVASGVSSAWRPALTNVRVYTAQYERLIAAAAGEGQPQEPGRSGIARQLARQHRGEEQKQTVLQQSKPGRRPPEQAEGEERYTPAITLAPERPVVALAAASGVVLAAAQEPFCHILSYSKDYGLRSGVKLPLYHLDAAFADQAAISADGGTAALSLEPLPPAGHRANDGGGFRSRVLAVVDVAAGRVAREIRAAPSGRTTTMVISPTANLLASGCAASWARVWDVRLSSNGSAGSSGSNPSGGYGRTCSGTCVVSVDTRQGGISSLLLDSGRLRLFTGGRDGTVSEWDLRRPKAPVVLYSGHSGWVTAMELLPSATAATSPGARPQPVRMNRSGGTLATLLADPPSLVTASADWTVRVWRPPPPAPCNLEGLAGTAVHFVPDSEGAAAQCAGDAAAMLVRDEPCVQPQCTADVPAGPSFTVRAGRSGGSAECTAEAAVEGDGRHGKACKDGEVHGGVSAQGGEERAASGGSVYRSDGTAVFVPPSSTPPQQHQYLLPQPPPAVTTLRCSQPQAVLVGHAAAVTALHVQRDHGSEAAIFTGARDGSVGVWTADGRCRHLLPCHRRAVNMVLPCTLAPRLVDEGRLHGASSMVVPAAGAAAASEPGSGFATCDFTWPSGFLTCGGDGLAAVWARRILGAGGSCASGVGPAATAGGASPLVASDEAGSLARVVAWDASRGVLLRGDEHGVVRAWAPPSAR